MKQEMEEKGSSMSDGGEAPRPLLFVYDVDFKGSLNVCLCVGSSGGEDQAESDQVEAGDRSDGRPDWRRRAHAAAGQTQGEVQHDARHARHQHPGEPRRALRLAVPPHQTKPC